MIMSFRFGTLRARLIGSSALAFFVLLAVCIQFWSAFRQQEAVVRQIEQEQIARLESLGRLMLLLSENQVQLSDLLTGAIEHKLDEEAVFERGRQANKTIRAIDARYKELRSSFQNETQAQTKNTTTDHKQTDYRASLFSVVDLC